MSYQGKDSIADWSDLVEQIQNENNLAVEKLYLHVERGVRLLLYRRLGPEQIKDRVNDVFRATVEAIKSGRILEPLRLLGYIRALVERYMVAASDQRPWLKRSQVNLDEQFSLASLGSTPEGWVVEQKRIQVLRKAIAELDAREREILLLFYLQEQSATQICNEMGLTDTQFRRLKARAKAHLTKRS